MTPFERWSQEVQALLAWHGIDPASVAREDLWRMFSRGDSAIEAARLTANGVFTVGFGLRVYHRHPLTPCTARSR